MDNYTIGCDAHKHYSVFAVLIREGVLKSQKRVEQIESDIIKRYIKIQYFNDNISC